MASADNLMDKLNAVLNNRQNQINRSLLAPLRPNVESSPSDPTSAGPEENKAKTAGTSAAIDCNMSATSMVSSPKRLTKNQMIAAKPTGLEKNLLSDSSDDEDLKDRRSAKKGTNEAKSSTIKDYINRKRLSPSKGVSSSSMVKRLKNFSQISNLSEDILTDDDICLTEHNCSNLEDTISSQVDSVEAETEDGEMGNKVEDKESVSDTVEEEEKTIDAEARKYDVDESQKIAEDAEVTHEANTIEEISDLEETQESLNETTESEEERRRFILRSFRNRTGVRSSCRAMLDEFIAQRELEQPNYFDSPPKRQRRASRHELNDVEEAGVSTVSTQASRPERNDLENPANDLEELGVSVVSSGSQASRPECNELQDPVNVSYETVVSAACSRSSSPELDDGVFEVEKILDFERDKDEELFYIKWKNYDLEEDNTWEPARNLNCPEKLLEFYLKRKTEYLDSLVIDSNVKGKRKKLKVTHVPLDPRSITERCKEFCSLYGEATDAEINATCMSMKTSRDKPTAIQWEESKLSKNLDEFSLGKLNVRKKDKLRSQALFILAEEKSNDLAKKLKDWENEINSVTNTCPIIEVENNVNLNGPPSDFTYINDYFPTGGIIIPDDPPLGCNCTGNCTSLRRGKKATNGQEKDGMCCPKLNGNHNTYYDKKRLVVGEGVPIYECNKMCKCGGECPNRVVQDGVEPLRGFSLTIFQTKNGCGWGVKTPKRIPKGTFVCMYVGEIIDSAEALKRGRLYDEVGSTYLFDLDINEAEGQVMYTVDACMKGNVSHFINHSCDPNLTVYNVWVNCLDPNLPKLALFSNRVIPKDTEITFDYKSNITASQASADGNTTAEPVASTSTNLPLIRTKPCLCGAATCRKTLF